MIPVADTNKVIDTENEITGPNVCCVDDNQKEINDEMPDIKYFP